MFERLTQDQFEEVIHMLIVYKTMNPKKDVYLNETSFHEALLFMKNSVPDYPTD